MRISGVQYTMRNNMYIILGLCIEHNGKENIVSYAELERLKLPGLTFVNVLIESNSKVSIVPTIVYQEKPIHKYIENAGTNGPRGINIVYTKEIFDKIKTELVPFSQRHIKDFKLYLYTDLFFQPKKDTISACKPIDEFLVESGVIDVNTADQGGLEIDTSDTSNVDNILAELAEFTHLDTSKSDKIKTVDEINRQQMGVDYDQSKRVEENRAYQPQENINIYGAADNQNNTFSQNINEDDVSAIHFTSNISNKWIEQKKVNIHDIGMIMQSRINEKWINTGYKSANQTTITEITRMSLSWLLISYIDYLTFCDDSCLLQNNKDELARYVSGICNMAISLRMFSNIYKVTMERSLRELVTMNDTTPEGLRKVRNILHELLNICYSAVNNYNGVTEMIHYRRHISTLNEFCYRGSDDSNITVEEVRIVKSLDEQAVIAFKYIARLIKQSGVKDLVFGDIKDLLVMCQIYKAITQGQINIDNDIAGIYDSIKNVDYNMAWSIFINSVCTKIS